MTFLPLLYHLLLLSHLPPILPHHFFPTLHLPSSQLHLLENLLFIILYLLGSHESLLHNSSIQNPSCPDTALTSITPTSDPFTYFDPITPIPTIITTNKFFFFHHSTMSILHWNIHGFRSHKNYLRYLLSIYELSRNLLGSTIHTNP